MNKILFFIITMLFANLSIDAQSYKIYGHVYFHDKSQPLSYASVKNCNTQQVVLSDSVGYFAVILGMQIKLHPSRMKKQ